jgi:hypothetical protein
MSLGAFRPTVAHWMCSGIMSPISGGARFGVPSAPISLDAVSCFDGLD